MKSKVPPNFLFFRLFTRYISILISSVNKTTLYLKYCYYRTPVIPERVESRSYNVPESRYPLYPLRRPPAICLLSLY